MQKQKKSPNGFNLLEIMLENKDFGSLIKVYKKRLKESKANGSEIYNMINSILKSRLY